jgi:hypothetical protein
VTDGERRVFSEIDGAIKLGAPEQGLGGRGE